MDFAEFDRKPVVCGQNDTQQSPDCWVIGESEKYKIDVFDVVKKLKTCFSTQRYVVISIQR